MVKPKKHLGQHFLTDQTIASNIVEALSITGCKQVVEIGPGTGVLSQYLLSKPYDRLWLCEIDTESIEYLINELGVPDQQIVEQSFLKLQLNTLSKEPIAVIGNFPYNISSQILFRIFDQRDQVPEVVGMFQKEVAERVAAGPGSKTYGILSVLLQAFYDIEYLFTVDATAFFPPPKVQSGVIRMVRNNVKELPCDSARFVQVVKAAFNQRRKTLNNALKGINPEKKQIPYADKRAETLSVQMFVEVVHALSDSE